LANPVYAGKTLVFTPHLAAGFGNPAEHHGNSQRALNLDPGMENSWGIIVLSKKEVTFIYIGKE